LRDSRCLRWWEQKAEVAFQDVDPSLENENKLTQHGTSVAIPPWTRGLRVTLWPVECAIGTTKNMHLIGLLKKDSEGPEEAEPETPFWSLFDLQQSVKLDLTNCRFEEYSYFVEGSVVIAAGRMSKRSTFNVYALYLPPRETDDDLKFPLDMYGGGRSANHRQQLIKDHKTQIDDSLDETPDETWIVFGEVQLNSQDVQQTLRNELQAIETALSNWYGPHHSGTTHKSTTHVPVGIVFFGNFHQSLNSTAMFNFTFAHEYTAGFADLAKILIGMPLILKYCQLVFVPGHADPGPHLSPKPPIPALLTNNLSNYLQKSSPDVKCTFGSNPCRIRYKSREMVFYRVDMTSALAEGSHALHWPKKENRYCPSAETLAASIPKLIASQGCLNPTNDATCTADFAFALRLDPLPDLVCVADTSCAYVAPQQECFPRTVFVNPGVCTATKVVYYVNCHKAIVESAADI